MSIDYKNTISLPKTDFAMRGNLTQLEPNLLKRWQEINLWRKMRNHAKGREKFILHDGPPYANGHLHIGHALNKILKDIINRTQQMMGKDAHYIPGWDCHGLPIEWKIEEQYRAQGKNKDDVPINEFRQECRAFAEKWIDIQREEFKRLGVLGDWDNPYLTMDYKAEATIAAELGKFIMSGALFRGAKPVLWSVVEKTALAEAEVEYLDHRSLSIYVRYPIIVEKSVALAQDLHDAQIVIWTTTPWTIPGSRGVAFQSDNEYGLYEITTLGEKSNCHIGDKIILSTALLESFCDVSGLELSLLRLVKTSELEAITTHHPLYDDGIIYNIPVRHGDFVTDEQGSGFVHINGEHGVDDFNFSIQYGLDIPQNISEDGVFLEHVPLFAGCVIYDKKGKDGDANLKVIEALKNRKALLGVKGFKHSYPHSWRSKAPLIYRNTPQWFIAMEYDDLRQKALKAIDETAFYPKQGQTRLRSMIETRPDWCVSRQRAWGVPLPIFIDKNTNNIIRDQQIIDNIVNIFEKEGADAWFTRPLSDFLGDAYKPDDVIKIDDVVDVWFDSGSTHSFVLEQRDGMSWPASLYLEGADQHRGWFHSSLLEACGTRGRAPYDAVLTHGFIMAEDGRKMSKSLGNIVTPQQVINQYGVEILRIWVMSSDYTTDLTIGVNSLKQQADMYRRLRNSLRWLLGNLSGYQYNADYNEDHLPSLEKYMLHRLYDVGDIIIKSNEKYDFHMAFRVLHDFCALDLSAFYFDIRKDSLYCDAHYGDDSTTRQAAQYVLYHIFHHLCRWLAPIICFTAEEAWLHFHHVPADDYHDDTSIHLQDYCPLNPTWHNTDMNNKWEKIKSVRKIVLAALEIARNNGIIGSALEAKAILTCSQAWIDILQDEHMADYCITSDFIYICDNSKDIPQCDIEKADGDKCIRCWKILPEVAKNDEKCCQRCLDAVAAM